jgi:hypothetical protein
LESNRTAFNSETSDALNGRGLTIEKKTARSTVNATFILTGILRELKIGTTTKKADILVKTTAKESSFSMNKSIDRPQNQ